MIKMPKEEWADFRDNALGRPDDDTQNFLKIAFIGGLASATEFFQNLITGDLDPVLKQDLFERWVAGLSIELEDYNRELTRLMEIRYGRTH